MMRTISPRRRKENLKIIREHGFPYFVRFVKEQMQGDLQDYEVWRKAHQISPKDLKKQQAYKFSWNPKMSIAIPLYNTPIPYLEELLQSIVNQTYANWELCLADGSTDLKVGTYIKEHYGKEKRIKYCKLKENLGIAGNTNAAVEMATGEYVMLCDHDDLVAPDALFEMAKALNKDHTIDILYTDEDLVNSDTTEFSSPRFKPDFNFDFLRSINYICHIFMVRKSILDEVGCFREEYDGAQDYDFIHFSKKLNSYAVRRQKRFIIFPKSCIIGGRMRILLREILRARSMRYRQGKKPWRSIIAAWGWMRKCSTRVFLLCSVQF